MIETIVFATNIWQEWGGQIITSISSDSKRFAFRPYERKHWQFHHKKKQQIRESWSKSKWMVKSFFLPISFFTPIWFCWIFWCQGLYQVEDASRHWMHNFSSMPSWTTPQPGFSSMLPCSIFVETCQHPKGVISHINRKTMLFFTREIPAKCPYPYHPCMVYLPTYGWFVYGKCREIYHTWIVWDIFAVFLITLKGVIWWHDPCIHKGLIHRNPTIWPLARNKSHRSFGQGSKFMNGIFCWRLVDFVCCSCR